MEQVIWSKLDSSTPGKVQMQEEYRAFTIWKSGLVRCVRPGRPEEFKSIVEWKCRGSVRSGANFVSLEPGPYNVLLRRCPGSAHPLFTVVAWAGEMQLAGFGHG